MAISWRFDKNDVENFPLVPAGDHRARIKTVEEKQSRSGKDMFVIDFELSGQPGTVRNWMVLDPDNTTATNTRLSRFWEAFGIPEGTMNGELWIGKTGAVRIKHEADDMGEVRAKVHYPIERRKQESLPPWQEPKGKKNESVPVPDWVPTSPEDLPGSADDLPF